MFKRFSVLLGLTVIVVMASVSLAYAGANSGYAAWNASAGGNGSFSATPHKNYTTTTVKCAVCHAVHKGTSTGELLLRGTASGSCEYCHIADNIGLVRIYAGNAVNYTTNNAQAHNENGAGTNVGSRCTDCHAIHGANTMTDSSVDKYILKNSAVATGNVGGGGVSTPQAAAVAAKVPGNKQSQITAFCTMCHPYYQGVYNGTITVATYHAGGTIQNGTFQSHIMGPAKTNYANNKATYTGQAAWVPSTYCRSCHDAGLTDQQGVAPASTIIQESYPHYTPSFTRFMVSKAYSNATTDTTSIYTVTPMVTTSNFLPDGVCLKCHRGTGGVGGVGTDF